MEGPVGPRHLDVIAHPTRLIFYDLLRFEISPATSQSYSTRSPRHDALLFRASAHETPRSRLDLSDSVRPKCGGTSAEIRSKFSKCFPIVSYLGF